MRTISKLVVELHNIQILYGDVEVRIDLGSETQQRAYGVGYAMSALFGNEDSKIAVVLFLAKSKDKQGHATTSYTCASLIQTLLYWHQIMGDVEVRIDLGFVESGYCYDIDQLLLGDFPNEQKQCAVLFPANSRTKIIVRTKEAHELN